MNHIRQRIQFVFIMVLIILAHTTANAVANELAAKFNFDGYLTDSSGNPRTGTATLLLQIYNPAETCLLFEETHSNVALDSNGGFSVKVGGGTRASSVTDGAVNWKNLFQNITTIRAAATPNCSPGYTPNTLESRMMKVTVDGTVLIPSYSLAPVPMATVAQTLQGKVVDDFALASSFPTCTAGEALHYDGTAFTCITVGGGGGGTVTNVTSANSYLSIATSATTPALTLNVGTTINTVAAGNDSRFSDSRAPSGVASGDLAGSYPTPTVATVGTKSASQIATSVSATMAATDSPTASTLVKRNALGDASFVNINANAVVKAASVDFSNGTYQVKIKPPMGLASNYDLTLPYTLGFNGQVLATNAIGELSWMTLPAPVNTIENGGNSSGLVSIGTLTPNPITFQTSGVEQIRITPTGNVGIGSASPTERLHVVGNLRVEGTNECLLGVASGGVSCTSDSRMKENIREIQNPLAKILRLRGVEFDWNDKSLNPGHHDIGVIAQEVEKIFPTAVYTDPRTGFKKVDYAVLVAPLIASTKQLNEENKQLKAQLDSLDKRFRDLEKRLAR